MSVKPKILVVDDEHSVRWGFEKAMQKEGYDVALADNGRKGLELYKSYKPDLTLVDIRMPEMDGLQLLEQIRGLDTEAQVIVMTAYADMDTTVTAMKLGAYDFLSKPFNIDECLLLVSKGLKARKCSDETDATMQAPQTSGLVGNSLAMQEVYKLIGKVSGEDVTVLVTGASGSGKELVAQAIHNNSTRAHKTFWAINCTAINASLMESELFGYEKGSFTGANASKPGMFELAQGGTIFLDEIGDMNLEMQAKLLRVLEEREIVRVGGSKRIKVDVRIIAATNRNLINFIATGKFREDLYHRIKVIEIRLPSLKERPRDIPLLAKHFCSMFAAQRKGIPKTISDEAMQILGVYPWPGNVRELRNAIEQSYTLSRDKVIMSEHLPTEVKLGKLPNTNQQESIQVGSANTINNSENENIDTANFIGATTASFEINSDDICTQLVSSVLDCSKSGNAYADVIETVEKELLFQTLERHKWNQVKSANYLGITRNTLRSKIDKYDL